MQKLRSQQSQEQLEENRTKNAVAMSKSRESESTNLRSSRLAANSARMRIARAAEDDQTAAKKRKENTEQHRQARHGIGSTIEKLGITVPTEEFQEEEMPEYVMKNRICPNIWDCKSSSRSSGLHATCRAYRPSSPSLEIHYVGPVSESSALD